MRTWPLLFALLLPWAAHSATFALQNGDKLNGTILEQTDQAVVIDHPLLGRVVVPKTALAPGTRPDPGAFGRGWLVGWKRQLGFGLVGEEGNTDSQDISADIRLNFENDLKRLEVRGDYKREEDNNNKNKNQARIDIRRDWLIPGSRWFTVASARYERDSFESWSQRFMAGGGLGYAFLDTDTWSLRGLSGVTLTRTSGNGSDHDVTPEALLGVELAWQVNELNELTFRNIFHPSFDVLGVYRNLTRAAWKVKPGGRIPWSIEFGIENEYESDVENPTKNNDFDYSVKLLWDF